MTVTGTSGTGTVPSTFNVANQLTVGGGATGPGRGVLIVQSGGLVTVGGSTIHNQNSGGNFTSSVTVDGAGSLFSGNVLNSAFGSTTFTVQNAGAATFAATVSIATQTGSTGGLTVTGTGSSFTTTGTGQLQLGGSGTTGGGVGTLTVGAGATVTVADRLLLFGAGTVNSNGGPLTVGGLASATAGAGTISVSSTGLTISDGLGATYSGVITGSGSFNKNGPGTQTFSAANTYSGDNHINGGLLQVTNTTGSALGSGSVKVTPGGTLAGTGIVTGLISVEGGVSPGTSVGTLNVGSMLWNGGGRYDFEFSSANSDQINGTGTLNLANLNSSSRFTINILSYDASLTTPQTYTIASFAGSSGITGFDAAAGNPQFLFAGLFVPGSASVALVSNNFRLTFTPVPEPAAILALCALPALVIGIGRRLRSVPRHN